MNLTFLDFYAMEYDRLVRAFRPLAAATAEDIAQEAFLVAERRWEEISTLDVPFAWVRRVAFRMAGRQAQRDRMRNERESMVSNVSPRYADADLLEAIDTLPRRQAIAIWLHHIEDQPLIQVADKLECSMAATKVLLHRGRQKLASRVSGLEGRWTSGALWTPDAIRAHLRTIDAGRHVDTVLERDLGGQGGRWDLTMTGGSYSLHRDDGLRLDYGTVRLNRTWLELRPTQASGRVLFGVELDGDRLRINQVDNTTPPTMDVPDWVWMSLFLASGFFGYSGRPDTSA